MNSEPFFVFFSSNSTGINSNGDKIFSSLFSLSTHSKKPIAKYKVLTPFSVNAVLDSLLMELIFLSRSFGLKIVCKYLL